MENNNQTIKRILLVTILFAIGLAIYTGGVSAANVTEKKEAALSEMRSDRDVPVDHWNGVDENASLYLFGTGQQAKDVIYNETLLKHYYKAPNTQEGSDVLGEMTLTFETPQKEADYWNQNTSPTTESFSNDYSHIPTHANEQSLTDSDKTARECPDNEAPNGLDNPGGIWNGYTNFWDIEPSVTIISAEEDSGGHIRRDETIDAINKSHDTVTTRYTNSTPDLRMYYDYRFITPYDYKCTNYPNSDTISKDYSFSGTQYLVSQVDVNEHDNLIDDSNIESEHFSGDDLEDVYGIAGKQGTTLVQAGGISGSTRMLTTRTQINGSYTITIVTKTRDDDGDISTSTTTTTSRFGTNVYNNVEIRRHNLSGVNATTYLHPAENGNDRYTTSVISTPHPYAGYRIGNITERTGGGNDNVVDDIIDGIVDIFATSVVETSNNNVQTAQATPVPLQTTTGNTTNTTRDVSNMLTTGWSVFYARNEVYDEFKEYETNLSESNSYSTKTEFNPEPPVRTFAFPSGNPPDPNLTEDEGQDVRTPRQIEPQRKAGGEYTGLTYDLKPNPNLSYADPYPATPGKDLSAATVHMDNIYYNHTKIHVRHNRNVTNTDVRIWSLGNPDEYEAVQEKENTNQKRVFNSDIRVFNWDNSSYYDIRWNPNKPNKITIDVNWRGHESATPGLGNGVDGGGTLYIENTSGEYKLVGAPPNRPFDLYNDTVEVKTNLTGVVAIKYDPPAWEGDPKPVKPTQTTVKVLPIKDSSTGSNLVMALFYWVAKVFIYILPVLLMIYYIKKGINAFSWSDQSN